MNQSGLSDREKHRPEKNIIGHMGLFFYNQKGSIISIEDLPTTEIIEPQYEQLPVKWTMK